jgi:hypothetical protein
MSVAFPFRHRRLSLGLLGLLVGATVGIGTVGQVSAAAQVGQWARGELSVAVDDVTSVGCNAAGGITFNGAALEPSIACAEILELTLGPSTEFGGDMVIDVRGVTAAKFPALRVERATKLIFDTRKVLVYGSPLADVIIVGTGSVAYGRGGNDTMVSAKRSSNTELWGGEGDDFLVVDGPNFARLEGGPGNDLLENTGFGSMNGGDGDDTLDGAGGGASMYGGAGNDVINARPTEIGFSIVVDGGPGDDRLAALVYGLRVTATSLAGSRPTIRISSSNLSRLDAARFEKVSLTGVEAQRVGVTMDPITSYEVAQPALPGYRLVVTVPTGPWTISGNTVSATGFGSVTWANTTDVVVRGTAS